MGNKKVAVIGLGCFYAGSKNPMELWENVLTKRQQFRDFPECRLPLADYYDRNKKAVDKTYSRLGAFIDGFVFDWKQKRIPKALFDSADLVHWLALDVAEQALIDSGYTQGQVPKERIGVIVGNSMNGEISRANTLRLRWPFVGKVFREVASNSGFSDDEIKLIEDDLEKYYKSFFPPMTGHSLSGALSNVIAGRICNFFDFNGGGYVVDGACASSLIAVITAAQSIAAGELDMVVAGGVDISLDINELTGFSRVGALADNEMKVYDKNANGFLPGEGCGFAVLKDFELAKRDGDCIYALIRGYGLSSDGKGGIMTPSVDGQALAMKKAYDLCDYNIDEVDFIEGHGTGTDVGDRVELEAIRSLFGDSKENHKCLGITSFKSIAGHTKSAAGIGAFIKSVIAVNQRVLPPIANIDFPNKTFSEDHMPVYPIVTGEILDPRKVMRAGISAMGFGGINSHVTIESYGEPLEKFRPELEYSSLLSSYQKTELMIFSADSREAILEKVSLLIERSEGVSVAEVTDLAYELCKKVDNYHPIRCSVIISNRYQLSVKLEELRQSIISHFPDEGRIFHDAEKNIIISNCVQKTRVGLLFPGQGSQKLDMTKYLIDRFPWARELALEVDAIFADKGIKGLLDRIYRPMDKASSQHQKDEWNSGLKDVRYAHGAVVLSSLIWLEYFKRLGIRYAAVGGHSLGELAAFYAAGAYSRQELIEFAAVRGIALSHAKEAGKMVSLKCSYEKALQILTKTEEYAVVANYNSIKQIIVSGSLRGIDEVIAIAGGEGVKTQILDLDNAFHSKLVSDCAEELRKQLNIPDSFQSNVYGINLFSSLNGREIKEEVKLSDYFYTQMQKGVNFVPMMNEMKNSVDLLIEIGPGKVLSNLNNSYIGDVRTIPAEAFANDDESLNSMLAALFAYGNMPDWEAVYHNRYIRRFEYPEKKSFIVNPCESKPEINMGKGSRGRVISGTFQNNEKDAPDNQTESVFQEAAAAKSLDMTDMETAVLQIVADETGFDAGNISLDLRLLDDLNLDSIKSAELFLKIADKFNVADQVDINNNADLTIGQIIENFKTVIEAGNNSNTHGTDQVNWVRNFVMAETECEPDGVREEELARAVKSDTFIIVSEDEDKDEEFISLLRVHAGEVRPMNFAMLESVARTDLEGRNLLVFLPAVKPEESFENSYSPIVKILSGLNISITAQLKCIMFIHNNDREEFEYNGLKAYLSSIHHEKPFIKIKSIAFRGSISKNKRINILLNELYSKNTEIHMKYTGDGIRKIPVAKLLQPEDCIKRINQLNSGDVILVTGGAKGITAECAFGLARKTGAKMALLGTTPEADSNEIQKNLERYKTYGLAAKYYVADVTNYKDLEEKIKEIVSDFGNVTGVIHGAGINKPRQADTVSYEEALKEIAPKVSGVLNLTNIFNNKMLKLFVGFDSVIGVAGLPGNAWYAFANENMKDSLFKFKQENPATDVVSIAYSLWKDVGMGAKMGAIATLLKRGVGAIDIEEGVRRFLYLTEFDPGCVQVIVTSSLGGLETWKRTSNKNAEKLRFVENIIKLEPDVEIVSKVLLNKERDLYLNHHIFDNKTIFPTVFGLEAMAQNVSYLTGIDDFSGVEINNLKLSIPIIADNEKGVNVKIHAIAEERLTTGTPLKVNVKIFAENTNYGREHFSAEFVLKKEKKIKEKKMDILIPDAPYELIPKYDLYNWLFFHGPLFQRIDKVYMLEPDEIIVSSVVKPKAEFEMEWYNGELPHRLLLGDPFLRDSGLQAGQLGIPKEISLPVEIQSIEINKLCTSQYFVHVKKTYSEKDIMLGEVHIIDNEGNILEKYGSYKSQIISRRDENPAIEQLRDIQGLYSHFLQSHLETFRDRIKTHESELKIFRVPNVSLLEKEERHRLEKEIFKVLSNNFKESSSEFILNWESTGKPFIDDCTSGQRLPVSISHDNMFILYSMGKISQGCDIEPVKARELSSWEGLIGKNNISILHMLLQEGCELDLAGTSIWSALECFKKASSVSGITIDHYRKMDKGILFSTMADDTEYKVLAFPVAFLSKELRIAAFTVEEQESLQSAVQDSIDKTIRNSIGKSTGNNDVCFIDKGTNGQAVYNYRFKLSFKDIATLRRKVNYSSYAFYMGKLREIPLEPILDQLIGDLSSGSWAWVTNDSCIRIFDELTIGDELLGRIWVSKYINNSRVDVNYEWYKIDRNNEMTLVATSTLGSSWVRVLDHGLVQQHQMPGYLDTLFTGLGIISEADANTRDFLQHRFDQGEVIWENKSFPKPAFIHTESFETTLEDSNLVGNLYFAHYYQWQSKTKDMYLYKILSKYFNNSPNPEYDLFYSRAEVKHLREAMPFDKITVRMAIRSIHTKGIKFYFEYYKSAPDGHMEKIAFSELDTVWVKVRGKGENNIAMDMPEGLVKMMLQTMGED